MKSVNVWAFFVVSLLLCSCHRRPLDEVCLISTKIPIGTLWNKSEVQAKNVTVYFYDKTDGTLVCKQQFENRPTEIQTYAYVPPGCYTVVFHNEISNQIQNVSERGYENLSTLEFYTEIDSEAKQIHQDADVFTKQPGVFATAIVHDVLVEPNVENRQLIGIAPEQKNSYIDITVHVKGLNNTRMPILANLRNVASSYFVDQDQPSTIPSTIQFRLNDRVYDVGSETEGSVSATIALLGTLKHKMSVSGYEKQRIFLDLMFMLRDSKKTIEYRSIDVTSMLLFSKNLNGSIQLVLDLSLPESLPEVEPEGSIDAGFGSSLEDWESVDIPLEL